MRAALLVCFLAGSAWGQGYEYYAPPPPPVVETDEPPSDDYEPDLPIEAQRESEEARSRARIAFTANFGIIADPGLPGSGNRLGPSFSFSIPFYMGTRRRHVQFLWDARVGAGWVPDKYALLQMSPMWGMNLYFGPYFGLETRMGFGFGAKLSNASAFGIAGAAEGGLVFRVFKDDRTRLKAIAGVGIQLVSDASVGGLSAYLGAGFETAL
jgi:hypothetical protein